MSTMSIVIPESAVNVLGPSLLLSVSHVKPVWNKFIKYVVEQAINQSELVI